MVIVKLDNKKKLLNNLKRGNESSINLIVRPTPKKALGIMVSGGISKSGLGNIIFHSGNSNIFSYKQVLDYYKADCNNFKPKFFQQDGARVYSSKGSQKKIQELFGNDFIPIWENGPELNGEILPKWPPNSPDLSSIEIR